MRTLRFGLLAAVGLLLFAGRARGQTQGFWIPQGGLDRWYSARNNAAKQRVEIVMIGDSTAQCSPGNEYSWLYQIRHDAILSGYTDGGLGMAQGAIAPQSSAGVAASGSLLSLPFGGEETFAPTVSTGGTRSGFSANDLGLGTFNIPPFGYASNTIGDYITLQGNGNAFRLLYSTYAAWFGGFTYSVDGGTATTVSCFAYPTLGPALQKSLYIGGLTSGTHTVRITNTSIPRTTFLSVLYSNGFPISPSVANGTSTIGPATYSYGVTGVNSAGETTLTPIVGSVTINSTNVQFCTGNIANSSQFTSYNIYRSTNGGTTYVKALNVVDAGGSYTGWGDTGSTLGGTPPTSSTAGTDAIKNNLQIWAEFMADTGLIWQNSACTGATFNNFGLVDTEPLNANPRILLGSLPQYAQSALTVYGTPTAGTYKISADNGQTWTSALAYNASVSAVQSALASLNGYAVSNIVFAGSPGSTVNGTFFISNAIGQNQNAPLTVQQVTAFSPTAAGVTAGQVFPANGAKGQYRNPTLTICALGINNQQGGEKDTYYVLNGLKNFVALSRAAGADPLVVIPHYHWANYANTPSSTDGAYATAFELAMKTFCQQNNVAWCNFNYALAAGSFPGINPTTGSGNPHLAQDGYNIEGDYLWTQVLGANQVTLTAPAGTDWTVTAPTWSVTSPASGVSVTQNIVQDGRTANIVLRNIAMTPYPNTGTLATAAAKYFGAVTLSDGLGHSFNVAIAAPTSAAKTTGRGRRLN